jgi:hypothetical protein
MVKLQAHDKMTCFVGVFFFFNFFFLFMLVIVFSKMRLVCSKNYFKIYNDKNAMIKEINCKTAIGCMCLFALDAIPLLQLAVVQHE